MAEVALRLEGLTKTFGVGMRRRVVAIRDLSLTVERGAVVALVGPNGAGKTTTLHTLLGLLRPDRGVATIFGDPAGSRAARCRIGFLSEIFYTYRFLTARRAMRFYAVLSGVPTSGLEARIVRHLERFGLGEAIDRRCGTFSKGMIQRLGLAQALLHEPELLLLDEPTTGLDPEGRKLVADVIAGERARGTAVFLSSHILSDAERVRSGGDVIRRGEVVLADAIATLAEAADAWDVEVTGWHAGLADALAAAGFAAEPQGEDGALLRCPSARKSALLRLLLDLPVDIRSVRRARRSLEEVYIEHVGGGTDG